MSASTDPRRTKLPRPPDDDGYRLWLRYERLPRTDQLTAALPGDAPVLAAARDELTRGLAGLLGDTSLVKQDLAGAALVVGTPASLPGVAMPDGLAAVGPEGFLVRRRPDGTTVLAANGDAGVLYGVFHLLRQLALGRPLADGAHAPRASLRMLDHWDNLDGTIERGYAGWSLWDWHRLPGWVSPRITDYARINASVGINAVAITSVNADAKVLTAEYLPKVAALADVLRPWGQRTFLTARFSAPIELGKLPTADPLDPRVAAWWRAKVDEITRYVPDFGGFLVKANSEGQPGPQDFGRNHADGANLLADALAPHGGLVIWRAFVYSAENEEDRAKQANRELAPLDGRFRDNVVLQVKNGPIDFQPREPHHPLFGAMPKTPLALEVQLTQEYLGFATHLAYLAPMFTEVLTTDTFAHGPGSTVARVVDGSLDGHAHAGFAAVSNVGTDRNWCGHPFAAANWYAFGRLAWDHTLSPDAIADEWLRLTFTSDERFVAPVKAMMLASREAIVDYMTPLGLHHLMARDHHYGPGPWVTGGRADWTSLYYHRADAAGVGFDRTASGSDAVSLYRSPLRELYADPDRCPETLLLWFHHVAWDRRMKSGRTLWDELCHRYTAGVAAVAEMRETWDAVSPLVDAARAHHVRALLAIQEQEARWWRNACLLYFQTFSRRPLPPGLPPLEGTLAEYQARAPSHVPGI
jgi:alpha-glucuronidase